MKCRIRATEVTGSMKMTALSDSEINEKLKTLPEWKFENKALVRVQTFPLYLDALEFVYRVGHAAEDADHHPDIFMNYKRVTVRYWTHKANGVSELDFMMAEKVEKLVAETYHKRNSAQQSPSRGAQAPTSPPADAAGAEQ